MKKYFMKGTEDEVQFGDMIELDLTKDMPNDKVTHHHLECKFIPELIDLLLKDEVIEEVESKEEKEAEENTPIDFTDDCPMMQEVIAANEVLELRVDVLEKAIAKLEQKFATLKKTVKNHVA